MDIDAIRKYCLSFPHTTENVQWGCDLCLKVDAKLFAMMPLEVAPVAISFKCTPDKFTELCERPGIKAAAYMARAQWVSLEQLNTLADSELRDLLAESYRLVWERLSKSRRAALESGKARASTATKASKTSARRKRTSGNTRPREKSAGKRGCG